MRGLSKKDYEETVLTVERHPLRTRKTLTLTSPPHTIFMATNVLYQDPVARMPREKEHSS